ncbi:hypothetical protein SK128_025642 [Halocaridina rubra]|uniref:Anaphase-promoting complex subunit 4-like WD40 domain-containing protein n=1 Tax=Halocaridina rubra TaxID=373956 RepID=A0AAN8XWK1_HALRR
MNRQDRAQKYKLRCHGAPKYLHLMVAAMGMPNGDIVGGSAEEVNDLNVGNEQRNSNISSSMHQTSFPVTQALVSLLAANSSLIHIAGKGDAVLSPVTANGGNSDPGIQLANALAACVMSTKLPHNHRQWAATQLVECIGGRARLTDAHGDLTTSLLNGADYTGALPRVQTSVLEGHTERTSNVIWLQSRNLLVTSGHDGSVRTWKISQRSLGSQEHTLVFQDCESSNSYPASPAALEHLVALPTGRYIAASAEHVLNVWPLCTTGGNIATWTSSSLITCLESSVHGMCDCIITGHHDGSVTLVALTASGVVPSPVMHAGRQDVYVSCLSWQDQDKDMAVGFSDGIVRVCMVNSNTSSVTVAAHQVSHLVFHKTVLFEYLIFMPSFGSVFFLPVEVQHGRHNCKINPKLLIENVFMKIVNCVHV